MITLSEQRLRYLVRQALLEAEISADVRDNLIEAGIIKKLGNWLSGKSKKKEPDKGKKDTSPTKKENGDEVKPGQKVPTKVDQSSPAMDSPTGRLFVAATAAVTGKPPEKTAAAATDKEIPIKQLIDKYFKYSVAKEAGADPGDVGKAIAFLWGKGLLTAGHHRITHGDMKVIIEYRKTMERWARLAGLNEGPDDSGATHFTVAYTKGDGGSAALAGFIKRASVEAKGPKIGNVKYVKDNKDKDKVYITGSQRDIFLVLSAQRAAQEKQQAGRTSAAEEKQYKLFNIVDPAKGGGVANTVSKNSKPEPIENLPATAGGNSKKDTGKEAEATKASPEQQQAIELLVKEKIFDKATAEKVCKVIYSSLETAAKTVQNMTK